MIKNNFKKIILSLTAVLLLIGVTCTTYASDILNELLQYENGNVDIKNEELEEIPEGTNNNINTNTNTNTNVNENKPETTPYAGVEDYSGLIFIVIFGISAIYAYRKVREYNV